MPDGPTIGLLGHETPLQEILAPTRIRALLGEAAIRGARLYFLSSSDCDVANGRVMASRFVDGAWQRMAIELPRLVVAAAPAVRPKHRDVQTWLQGKTRLLAFDTRHKHEVTAVLREAPLVSGHLIPEEVLVAERLETQLLEWLGDGAIVVKRSDGSLGTGVFFVLSAEDGFTVYNGPRVWHASAIEAVARLAGAIRERMKYRTYVVQRYVETRDAHGQPATIRADIARQPDDSWTVYRLTGRIAIGAKLVSNRAKGSATVDIESFLAARGVANVADRAAEIHALAEGVAKTLVRSPGFEACYEFGIDFAPDPSHRIWFIEANQRPLTHGAEVERASHVLPYWISRAAS